MHQGKTVVHVTHEAAEKMGGIGAVLNGLLTCQSYRCGVARSIIIGPLLKTVANSGLGKDMEVLYSIRDGVIGHRYAGKLSGVERKFSVSIIYGRRRFYNSVGQVVCRAEVILIDTRQASVYPVNAFKGWLYEEFDIESDNYENNADYEQYVAMAPAALAALRAIEAAEPDNPTVLIGHDYMGMPTLLAAMMDPLYAFKTVFYAHEVATVRHIVESRSGHDTMFYNVLHWAQNNNYYLDEIFGSHDFLHKHALTNASRFCDNIVAVSPVLRDELAFLSPQLAAADIDVAYNALENTECISVDQKLIAKDKLQKYAHNLLGHEPDWIFTHVGRMVTSKGLWRDLRVLWHINGEFARRRCKGVFFLLSTNAPRRTVSDIRYMEQNWQWPKHHLEQEPDLTEYESAFYGYIKQFNAAAKNIKIVLVNQFGWDRPSCGVAMPEDMCFMDLRMGSDVEFGQSIYEPFGIAQLEALPFATLCVISSVCGCLSFVNESSPASKPRGIITADYTQLIDNTLDRSALLSIDGSQRDIIEEHVSKDIARKIIDRLPVNNGQIEKMIQQGSDLAQQMCWDSVCRKYFLPALEHAYHRHRSRRIA